MQSRLLLALIVTAAALAAPADCAAQSQTPVASPLVQPQRLPSPTKHGGTYHVATGTWTRGGAGQVAALGPSVIYSNTAPSGYFSTAGVSGGFAPGSLNYDEGSLPGTFNTGAFASSPTVDEYYVDCVSMGYCDMGAPGGSAFRLRFFSDYTPCTLDTLATGTVNAAGLPAGGNCWIIDLDLSGGPQFCLAAEAEGVFDDDPSLDSFGWSFEYQGIPGTAAGFLLAGNPVATDPGFAATGVMTASNTYFGTTLCPGVGTGYLTQDLWWLEDPIGTASNCYFLGGYVNGVGCAGPVQPLSSFHLELASGLGTCPVCAACSIGFPYCMTNVNSTGVQSQIAVVGSDVVTEDNVTLLANVPPDVFGFFITSDMQGFVANPAGSEGNLCLGGMIGRFVGPGQIKNSGPQGEISLSTIGGGWSLSAIPQGTGFYAAVPGVTTHFQLWHRDVGPTSNFTAGVSVTWL